MILEILLGAIAGVGLEPFYTTYIFERFPITRVALIGAIPALLLSYGLALTVEFGFGLASRTRRKRTFAERAFGVSLFVNTFLQIEAAKIAHERALSVTAVFLVAGLAATCLAFVCVRYSRCAARLAELRASLVASRPSVEAARSRHADRPSSRPRRTASHAMPASGRRSVA